MNTTSTCMKAIKPVKSLAKSKNLMYTGLLN